VRLLAKVDSVFTLSGRGSVLATIRCSTDPVRRGDKIQLRPASGEVIDCEILAIELIKKVEGPCQEAYMVPGHLPQTRVPVGTEIWLYE
jgi:hypothetical protein